MLELLLMFILASTFKIQLVEASRTIYITGEGSVVPATANITTADDSTYSTDDNSMSILYSKVNSTQSGTLTNFALQWQDYGGLDGYIFGWDNGSGWQNETWAEWAGNPSQAWSNVTKTLPSIKGQAVYWQIWVNNTSNYWLSTGNRTIYIHLSDTLYVNYFDKTVSEAGLFNNTPFLDDSANYLLSTSSITNETSGWYHFEDTALTPQQVFLDVYWRYRHKNNLNITLHDGMAETVLTGDDLHGYWFTRGDYAWTYDIRREWARYNVTSILNTRQKINDAKVKLTVILKTLVIYQMKLTIASAPAPTVYGNGINTTNTGETARIFVKWFDPDDLSYYSLNHNASGTWLESNITAPLTDGWSNVSVTISASSIGNVHYKVWANDTNNKWTPTPFTEILPITYKYNASRYAVLTDVEKGTSGLYTRYFGHGLGRKSFYAVNSRLWIQIAGWVNPSNESDKGLYYWTTTDGVSWGNKTKFKTLTGFQAFGGGVLYAHYENRSGNDYIHVQYGSEQEYAPLEYRKGQLYSNGMIIWLADWQIAVGNTVANVQLAPNGLATTPSGYVWYGFANITPIGDYDNTQQGITFTQSLDGSWLTHTGFPKYFYPAKGYLESYVYSMNDDSSVYQVFNENNKRPLGVEINGHTYGSIEYISSMYGAWEARVFSGFSLNDDIYFCFRTNQTDLKPQGRLRYYWRNSTSNTWQIQDEIVTDYLSDTIQAYSVRSFPVISWSHYDDSVYVSWMTTEDQSIWASLRDNVLETWQERKRVMFFRDYYVDVDPNTVVPFSDNNGDILYAFMMRNKVTGLYTANTYRYSSYFETTKEPVVGGVYIQINKTEFLAPYIGLAILLAVAVTTVIYVKKRKVRHQ